MTPELVVNVKKINGNVSEDILGLIESMITTIVGLELVIVKPSLLVGFLVRFKYHIA